MAVKDYYFDESIICNCGHHVHARQLEHPVVCDCGDIEHSSTCPVETAFNK